jgi:hypothetical protein
MPGTLSFANCLFVFCFFHSLICLLVSSGKSSEELHQKIAALHRELLAMKADYDRLMSSMFTHSHSAAAATPLKPVVLSADAQRELTRSIRSRIEVMKLLIAAINALSAGPQIPNSQVRFASAVKERLGCVLTAGLFGLCCAGH